MVLAAPYEESVAEIVGSNADTNNKEEPKSAFLILKLALLPFLFG